jgi:hypothetical protein
VYGEQPDTPVGGLGDRPDYTEAHGREKAEQQESHIDAGLAVANGHERFR